MKTTKTPSICSESIGLTSSTHLDAIIRSIMICLIRLKNRRNITDNTHRRRVVLPRTLRPDTWILYMHFSSGMMVSQKHTRENRYWVFFVINMGQRGVCVNVVGKVLVPDLIGLNLNSLSVRQTKLTRGKPYVKVTKVIFEGRWSGRNTESSTANAAPNECPTITTLFVLYAFRVCCTADRMEGAELIHQSDRQFTQLLDLKKRCHTVHENLEIHCVLLSLEIYSGIESY